MAQIFAGQDVYIFYRARDVQNSAILSHISVKLEKLLDESGNNVLEEPVDMEWNGNFKAYVASIRLPENMKGVATALIKAEGLGVDYEVVKFLVEEKP